MCTCLWVLVEASNGWRLLELWNMGAKDLTLVLCKKQVFLITQPSLQPPEQFSVEKTRLRHDLSPSFYNAV